MIQGSLRIARWIDALNERVGRMVNWLVLGLVLLSAGNALFRYAFGLGSNAWLELQWYLFAAIFLLAAGDTLRHNGHVRVDVFYSRFAPRTQAWIDLFGTAIFLVPVMALILWFSWEGFWLSWQSQEVSPDEGGLIRWPVRLLLPLGLLLLILQGVSEMIKRVAFLQGKGGLLGDTEAQS